MIEPVSLAGSTAVAAAPARPAAELASSFATDLARAEAVSAQGLLGQSGPREVADAVLSAERSLQTAIAVRDKIVSSFLEISRMAI